jgi:Acetyltransferase (GNAT) domain
MGTACPALKSWGNGGCMSVIKSAIPADEVAGTNSFGSLTAARLEDMSAKEVWQRAFQSQRKDRRYYEIVEKTICPEFIFRYALIRDEGGRIRAVQPYFILEQDLLAGLSQRWRKLVNAVRRVWPGFAKLKTLMVGCAAGEGHFSAKIAEAQRHDAGIMLSNIVGLARDHGASLVVLKEFPASYRAILANHSQFGFARIPSMPMTRLDLSPYASFDDYLAKAIKGKRRTEFRKKFKAALASGPIEMQVVCDAAEAVDEIYPLYLQVFEKSKMHFEKLTKAYFLEMGRKIPDKARFFLWRRNGKLLAFTLCLVEGEVLYGEYIGLDYAIALEMHLYFYVMRDIISWAIANGYKSIVSSGLNYAPKLQMRHVLEPLDLYVRHTSPILNPLLKPLLRLAGPVRSEEILRQFPNYGDLWPEGPGVG